MNGPKRSTPPCGTGSWLKEANGTRWNPSYLLLTVTHSVQKEIEPIHLYTADEEITVAFGNWETHIPAPHELPDAEPAVIAEHATARVEQWLSGQVRTTVLTDASGKWCGRIRIKQGGLFPQLKAAAQWFHDFRPDQIEVRTPAKRDWRTYSVDPDWLQPPALSPGRLPK